jgi:hypothetical protein
MEKGLFNLAACMIQQSILTSLFEDSFPTTLPFHQPKPNLMDEMLTPLRDGQL